MLWRNTLRYEFSIIFSNSYDFISIGAPRRAKSVWWQILSGWMPKESERQSVRPAEPICWRNSFENNRNRPNEDERDRISRLMSVEDAVNLISYHWDCIGLCAQNFLESQETVNSRRTTEIKNKSNFFKICVSGLSGLGPRYKIITQLAFFLPRGDQ